ncbi:peptidase S8 family protein [Metarhizium robertsii]|uniref:Peptidase S8/S53, subtilisin/kexin/sedolisin n=2 Tax=Metarhizium robertsii TaxID=568076 RepID=E9F649_METRA|nr:Peptidase S8/S53, subtilisin/kexin/sedolisin [Metarhizium robertsii ARSEF 23]EFY96687.1 Peptidase S8/S53, subtilisin/kexin/sedolisin [Metarhizium robertsii ARSEF 23]EXU95799.1 peptidase S8 family protein [Metarhizium robertsii]
MNSLHSLVGLLLSASLASSGLVPRDASIPIANQTCENASIEHDTRDTRGALVSQSNAPGNLVRLSNNVIEGVSNYTYDESGGEGITVYVVDGGIRLTHEEFGGRATFGASFIPESPDDSHYKGRGTQIAGIIGGAKVGVAKKVKLVAVKITSDSVLHMVNALNFVIRDVNKKGIQGKAVICMPDQVPANTNKYIKWLDNTFKNALDAGVVVVVGAGDYNQDAGNFSPGRLPSIITVAAMDHRTDFHWPDSNWGSSVTMYAPGVEVETAANSNDTATIKTLSGTDLAAGHVAGLAAYIMALEGITEPAKVMSRLISLAEETGSRVHWTAPNTTTLVATNGLAGRLDPAIANKPVKKLRWIKGYGNVDPYIPCGVNYRDEDCGTLIYCDSYDRYPTARKEGFFKSTQECFDAHEPAPILPWREKPTTVRPESCHLEESAECPWVCGHLDLDAYYTEHYCGTKVFCELHDEEHAENKGYRPTYLQYKNAKACFDGHEPQPVSSNQTMPAAAT